MGRTALLSPASTTWLPIATSIWIVNPVLNAFSTYFWIADEKSDTETTIANDQSQLELKREFMNKDRGITIPGTGYDYLDEGAYGVIFVEMATSKIIKVYKRRANEEHVRSAFNAEVDAYNLAASSKEISNLVPGNFQLIPPIQVIDSDGMDISDEFFPELAFETDFVKGSFCKIGGVITAQALRVHRLFAEAGIHHTTDMSVTIGEEGNILKVIDFATVEHELWYGE